MKGTIKLPESLNLQDKTVLLRVDWNVTWSKAMGEEELIKIWRSADTIKSLCKRGARVVIATHLGRPKKQEIQFSTAKLLPFVESYLGKPVMFAGENLMDDDGLRMTLDTVMNTKYGEAVLLENMRYYPEEVDNDPELSERLASLADYYVNDAFASCHRAHASVAGVCKYLPHYAGPEFMDEIEAAEHLLKRPKKPFVAIVGGAKLSTKMPVIKSLLPKVDKLMIGGAMAHPFLAAKGFKLGKSLTEKESIKFAKNSAKEKKIVLPQDVLVVEKINGKESPRRVDVNKIKPKDVVGDIGTRTMREWAEIIKSAQTILWIGPVGIVDQDRFSYGSLVVGRAMASRSRGKAFGIVGGGDTVPVALKTGMSEWFDHISLGGGALLEFITLNGRLPGILALDSYKLRVTSYKSEEGKPKAGNTKIVKRVKKIKAKKVAKSVKKNMKATKNVKKKAARK